MKKIIFLLLLSLTVSLAVSAMKVGQTVTITAN